ncbi:TraR/DksA family transcriptional regulator [Candidatus Ulvibacter alkanivorans]|uniref:TraR/DksA family transcriptional regulator n=1 Tax=Candidatus Ulvibacter alkanivorans TaxID=2267620 RepID=UPI000DF3BD8C|nr:TraR/DksA C4-type zinc finger protein [Candidatus Ulvibacter alkanivorans]
MLDKKEIIKRIKEELTTTEKQIIELRELTKPIAPENAIGRVSRMDAINNKSINDAALQKATLKLNNLKVALSKVDDLDFGCCRRCSKPIPLGRILLLPHTVTCVNCAV